MSAAQPGCRLTIEPGGIETVVPCGTLLLTACARAGVRVPNLCASRGLCTTCSAQIIAGADHLDPPAAQERRMLDWIGAPPDVRLTCQTRIRDDVVLRAAISPIERLDYDPSEFPWTQQR